MSQLLFDAFTGLDGHTTTLTVQCLLDQQNLTSDSLPHSAHVTATTADAQRESGMGHTRSLIHGPGCNEVVQTTETDLRGNHSSATVIDEEDVFQCGKCKKQFTSLPEFMSHKKEHTLPRPVNHHIKVQIEERMLELPPQTDTSNSFSQLHVHALDQEQQELGQPIILSDSDILSFSMDQSALNLSSPPQGLSSLSSVIHEGTFITSEEASADLKSLPSSSANNFNLTTLSGQQIILSPSQLSQCSYVTSPLSSVANNTTSSKLESLLQKKDGGSFSNTSTRGCKVLLSGGETGRTILLGSAGKNIPGKVLYAESCLDSSGGVLLNYSDKKERKKVLLPNIEFSEANIEFIDADVELENGEDSQNYVVNQDHLGVNLLEVVSSKSSTLGSISESLTMPYQPITVSLADSQQMSVSLVDTQSITVSPSNSTHMAMSLADQPINVSSSHPITVSLSDTQPITGILPVPPLETEPIIVALADSPSGTSDGQGSISKPKKSKEAKKTKLKCTYCDKLFTKLFCLNQHMRSHTGEKPFQCVVCGRAFSQKSNVKKHMATHKVWPNGLSRTLPKRPLQAVIKINPATEEGEKEPVKDDKASRSTDTEDESSQVELLVDKSFVCQFCSSVFPSYYELKTHMKEHSNEKVYKCIQKNCRETFTDLDSFVRHTHGHTQEVQFRCHVCCKVFNSLSDLGVHQYTHNSEETKPGVKSKNKSQFRCITCKSKFVSPESLEHHLATSSHNFECPHCSKVFACERYLRRHLPTHGSNHSFRCDCCGKGFRTKQYLNTHMIVHSLEKPFRCEHCQAAFNRKDKLVRHTFIHESNKRFKCPFRSYLGCMKEFNRQDKLKLHLLTHSAVKPNQCRKCNKTFPRQELLKHHKCTQNSANSCQHCGTNLRKPQLSSHKCTASKLEEDTAPKEQGRRGVSRRGRGGRRSRGRPRAQLSASQQDDVPTIEIIVFPVGDQSKDPMEPCQMLYGSLSVPEEEQQRPDSSRAVT